MVREADLSSDEIPSDGLWQANIACQLARPTRLGQVKIILASHFLDRP